MQKYRADRSTKQSDGAIIWRTEWIGGPTLARINNCRMENLHGEPRVTAYITGEPDSWFSTPAKCWYKGCRLNGYITSDDERRLVFRHCYY